MTKPMIRIHNTETNEITDREMNDTELLEMAQSKKIRDDHEAAKLQAATDKAALLAKLGITAEEAALLLS